MRRRGLGNWIAPPRFLVFLALLPLGCFGWFRFNPGANWQDALAMGFDGAALVFLALLIPFLRDGSVATMRRHAAENDANRLLVLAITSILMLVVLAAVSGELRAMKAGDPFAMYKLAVTLVLIWLLANSVYALHYAHEFYASAGKAGADRGGILFPGTSTPSYSDFAYFAFTLGMTFQTSDVVIESARIRRIALMHGLAAFVFNIGVIAFTINALGGAG
jgi:uncharacterized membrane protein